MSTKLSKVVQRKSKRLGRGIGSGKGGHTSSRGQKGQKARTSVHILFEGFKTRKSLFKRLPLARGKGRLKADDKPIIINLSDLDQFSNEKEINFETLVKSGLIREKNAHATGVKVLANGEITKKVVVALPVSVSAKEKIEKAGGTVVTPKKSK